MQLPRVIIAAVFFVIGALIAIPALLRSTSTSTASSSTASPSASPSVSGSATARRGPVPSASASGTRDSRTGREPATPTAVPTRTRVVPPVSRAPRPTATTAPAAPLRATIGQVKCPGRTVRVMVTNTGGKIEDYAIEMDGSANTAGRLDPGESYARNLTLKEGRRTEVSVTWNNETVRAVSRTAECDEAGANNERLPHTGPGDAGLYAKTATGIAVMITGAIIFWWGGVWPRRREQIFPGKDR